MGGEKVLSVSVSENLSSLGFDAGDTAPLSRRRLCHILPSPVYINEPMNFASAARLRPQEFDKIDRAFIKRRGRMVME